MDPLEKAAVGRAHAALAAIYPSPRVELISDEVDLQREARVLFLCASRLGVAVRDDSTGKVVGPRDHFASPFLGHTLADLAEDSLKRAGTNTRGMAKSHIIAAAFGHTTSDFPKLLENTAHKLLVAAYNGARSTWRRVARLGDLTDFRVHNRFRFGGFSDLKTVNEAGRYEQGTISDAEKETITGVRKGRILTVTRELVVNDDLQALSDAARDLGNAATRTIDKDLYALLALNSGDGPTMSDGQPLFDATHGNIAGTAGAPTLILVDQARVLLAQQQDPSATDFIDLRPAIAWCPLALGSTLRMLNEAQYDPVDNKFQKPNVVRGLVRDVVDSPRLDVLSATAWYLLADPVEEPVFEVGFIGGMQEPRVEQQREFSSDGLQWKVVHEYGVAAIGWRGVVRNAGG
jgi:hypothetical protein